jgi:hypothetical protein
MASKHDYNASTLKGWRSYQSLVSYNPCRLFSKGNRVSIRKRRIVAAVTIFAVVSYLCLVAPTRRSSTRISLNTLKSVPLTYTVPLMSGRNYWGFVENLEFPDQDRFNPTVLSLPFLGGKSNATFVVVARDWVQTEEKDNGKVIDKRSVIASLLHDSFNVSERHRLTPSKEYHNRCQSLQVLDALVHSDKDLFPNCDPNTFEKHFMHVSGPEDPRIFWSHLGEPLMVYNSIGAENSGLCRHMYCISSIFAVSILSSRTSSQTSLTTIQPGLVSQSRSFTRIKPSSKRIGHHFQMPLANSSSTPTLSLKQSTNYPLSAFLRHSLLRPPT